MLVSSNLSRDELSFVSDRCISHMKKKKKKRNDVPSELTSHAIFVRFSFQSRREELVGKRLCLGTTSRSFLLLLLRFFSFYRQQMVEQKKNEEEQQTTDERRLVKRVHKKKRARARTRERERE